MGMRIRQGRWLRLIRGRRLDRNPLRRTSDRAETVILAGLTAAFLIGAPFAVAAGGSLAHEGAQQLQRTQLATRTHVAATTLEGLPPESQSRGAVFAIPVVAASWSTPGGGTSVGEIPVLYGTPAGTRISVWTTASGKLADPPLTDVQVASLETLGQVGSAILVATLFALTVGLARMELDRRRYAAWDADWQANDFHGRQRK